MGVTIYSGPMVPRDDLCESVQPSVRDCKIVAGIYRLIDLGSTTVNCMGDLVWTTMLSDMEKRRLDQIDAAQKLESLMPAAKVENSLSATHLPKRTSNGLRHLYL